MKCLKLLFSKHGIINNIGYFIINIIVKYSIINRFYFKRFW